MKRSTQLITAAWRERYRGALELVERFAERNGFILTPDELDRAASKIAHSLDFLDRALTGEGE